MRWYCPKNCKNTIHIHTTHWTDGCELCNGSGRVPKDVGLAGIILAIPHGVWSFVAGEDDWFCTLTIYNPGGDEEADPQVFKGADPDITLAALRAIAAHAQAQAAPLISPTA